MRREQRTLAPEHAMPVETLELIGQLQANISRVVLGKDEAVRRCVIALLAGEHVLLEDVPGVGKTLLGKAMARSVSATFHRIQFTPDLLPTDITGGSHLQRQDAGVLVHAAGRCSPTSSWPTRSTARRPARKARCWRR